MRKLLKINHFILAISLGALSICSALATTFYMRPFPETVADAATIVRGITGGSQAKWSIAEDGSRRIYTYFELQVREVLKGKVESSSISIRQMGGEVDGVGLQIAGTAQFAPGEDVVVLLGPVTPEGSYEIRGLTMGKMNLEQGPGGKEVLVGAAIGTGPEGEHAITLPGDESQDGSGDRQRTWSLADLKQVIEQEKGSDKQAKSLQPLKSSEKLVLSPPLRSTPAPEAPALQPSDSQNAPLRIILGAAAFGLVLIGGFIWMRRPR